jgi:ABC-2 type transport system ATP-binding protein
MIRTEEISKKYGDLLALKQVSIEIDRGSIISLVGPNGSGKSTLIKLILGLTRPTSGKIHLDDANVSIGYLTEINALPTGYKGRDILKKLELLLGVERSNSVNELTQLFGINEFFTKKIKGYSKGMQKKIGLLIAFTGDPDVVILDEPFEGIDTIDRDKLAAFLKKYAASGKTIILSTHILYELDSLCDAAHFLKKGSLVASINIEKDPSDKGSSLHFSTVSSEFGVESLKSSSTIADVYRRVYQ